MNPYLLLAVFALALIVILVAGARLLLRRLPRREDRPPAAPPATFRASDYYARTLRQAAETVGGEANLVTALNVPPEALARWLAGEEAPPIEVHLAALDLVTRGTPEEKTE